LVRGEKEEIENLLGYYAAAGRQPRLRRDEKLLEQDSVIPGVSPEPNLRLANAEDLAVVTAINAGLAVEETGHNPMTRDPQGMLERTARRIAQQRVWLLTQNGVTIFKADVISDTPQTAFLEGVFVRWQERRKGHGLRCISQLARNLITETKSICLVVNEENNRALAFYNKAGFKVISRYSTAYFSAV
jgi:predicted GNAT family acetyltransferase